MLATLRSRPLAFEGDGCWPIEMGRNDESVVLAYEEWKREEELKTKEGNSAGKMELRSTKVKLEEESSEQQPATKKGKKSSKWSLPPLEPIPVPNYSIEEILSEYSEHLYVPSPFDPEAYPQLFIDPSKDYSSLVNSFKEALFKEPSSHLALAYQHRDAAASERSALHSKKSEIIARLDAIRRQFAEVKAELLNLNQHLKYNSQKLGGWTHKVFELELSERPCGFNQKLERLSAFVERYGVVPSHATKKMNLPELEKAKRKQDAKKRKLAEKEGSGEAVEVVDADLAVLKEADGGEHVPSESGAAVEEHTSPTQDKPKDETEAAVTETATELADQPIQEATQEPTETELESSQKEMKEELPDSDMDPSQQANNNDQPVDESKTLPDLEMDHNAEQVKQTEAQTNDDEHPVKDSDDLPDSEMELAHQPEAEPNINDQTAEESNDQSDKENDLPSEPHFTVEETKALATFISQMKLKARNKSLAKTQPHRIRALEELGVNIKENKMTARFDEMFEKLLAYKKEMGTFRLPSAEFCKDSGDPDLIALHNWVFSQVGAFRYQLKTKKPKEVRKFLDIGFSFERWYAGGSHVFERDIPPFDDMARKYAENEGVAPPEYEEFLKGEGKYAGKKRKSLHGPRVKRYPPGGPDRRLKKNRVALLEAAAKEAAEAAVEKPVEAVADETAESSPVVENEPTVMEEDLGGFEDADAKTEESCNVENTIDV